MNYIKLTVSYDGTDFSGWQRQTNKASVQETVEDAIYKITGEKTAVIGSGRTDAGVHAEGQTVGFKTDSSIPPEKFSLALNTVLPPSVKVLSSEKAPDGFNARRDAKEKTYRYGVYLSETVKPLKDRYMTQVYGKVDIPLIKKCAELLVGEHDFKAFASSGNSTRTTVRTVKELRVDSEGENLFFTVTGTGFLYNMVRIIVGTLIKIGKGEIPPDSINKMLETKKRSFGGDTMPAKGLCLVSVKY